MKTSKIRLVLYILVFSQMALGKLLFAQVDHFVKIDFDQSNLTPGTTINIPIKMTGAQIGNFRHIIMYDHDVLTLLTGTAGLTIPPTSQIYGTPVNIPNANHASYPGGLYFAYTTPVPTAFDYNDEVVYILNFTFNGGITHFSWWPESLNPPSISGCWLRNTTVGTPIPAYWTGRVGWQVNGNGTAGGTSPILTSVFNGGDWNTPSTWIENIGGGTKVPSSAYSVVITVNDVLINPITGTGKCHNLNINSGGRLTLSFGKVLSVTGAFTIESDGSFVDQNQTSTLNATVKRSISGNYPGTGNPDSTTIWHYVSSPTSNATISTFLGCLLNKWTENSNGGTWDTLFLPLTLPLEVGKGYSVASYSTFGDAVFSGPLNTGNKTINGLTNSNPTPGVGNGYYGYNLLGNPYPSAFKWDIAVTRVNVDAAVYLWNDTNYISKLPTDNYEIQAEQGFFVHASASGGSVSLPNGNRVHSSGSFLKSFSESQLSLSVAGNDYHDETSIRFNDEATAGFDGEYDAYKLFGVSKCPQIFSILPDINLSINSLPDMNSQPIVPIGFKSDIAGTFTLNATGFESFTPLTNIYLTDLSSGKVQNLTTNPVYIFTASPTNDEHRFDLHFAPVGMDETGKVIDLKIYSYGKNVFVNTSVDLQGTITIYNLLGKVIVKKSIMSKTLNRIEIDSPGGYYLVKVVSDKTCATEKVYIY